VGNYWPVDGNTFYENIKVTLILPSSNLITVQQDATYSVYYISVGSSTCLGCWHPSSGARTVVITASGIDWLQWVKYTAINTNI